MAMVFPLLLSLGCAKQAEVDALRYEMALLNARVAALEASNQGNRPAVVDDAAARALYEEASALQAAGDVAGAIEKFEALKVQFPGTSWATRSQQTLSELKLVGSAVTSLDGVDWLQGRGDYGARVTVVVFFEEWCPHCRREMPQLQATWTRWRSQGLGVVGLTKITRSSTETSVREFLKEHGVGFPIGHEDGSLSTAYAVTGIPASVVVRDGVVIWRGHPARLTDEMLAGWLGA